MASLVLPSPTSSLGKCPKCSADIKIDPVWYQKLSEWLRKTNQDSLSTNGRLTVAATSDTNLQFSYRGSDDITRTANLTLVP